MLGFRSGFKGCRRRLAKRTIRFKEGEHKDSGRRPANYPTHFFSNNGADVVSNPIVNAVNPTGQAPRQEQRTEHASSRDNDRAFSASFLYLNPKETVRRTCMDLYESSQIVRTREGPPAVALNAPSVGYVPRLSTPACRRQTTLAPYPIFARRSPREWLQPLSANSWTRQRPPVPPYSGRTRSPGPTPNLAVVWLTGTACL